MGSSFSKTQFEEELEMKRITVESGLSKNYLSSLNKLKINGNARNVYIAIRGRI